MSITRPLAGPGSQPDDEDGDLAFMELPKGMATFSMPQIPEPEVAAAHAAALEKLDAALEALRAAPAPGTSITIDLLDLDADNRAFVDQMLGEGEVSIVAGSHVQAQESVLAGVWRIHVVGSDGALIADAIEVGEFPLSVLAAAQDAGAPTLRALDAVAEDDLMNAPSIAAELADKLAAFAPGTPPHAINLTLLPVSDGDLAYLDARLGQGAVTILSRGYGNCRISSTGVRNAWWVRYFNSREILILNTIEVCRVPDVACAAREDLEDSAERLAEILGVYR
ncbi:HupH hydrogenase expression protein [Rhodomicrobium vannielii ATCC 17100]|uniref:HupH hydrogenase expression protein n=1 Tax=Rhodomicrobium vannielii (strain ATCC 17100 / DSM 162 / LMG 4299 / NCIMB 10020 / ATH 3.1.1) TaxID=648757 RepID=E3I2G3_RHOVT|nr:hydrogenase expression/formation protein [Rhodomicrobium vannielii]ADP70247.1 HupH hydrogenase expression protein [Rhodomicrobium vannielii ATCC 17100]